MLARPCHRCDRSEKGGVLMTESTKEARKRAWKTRREKYGHKGHSGSYGGFRPFYIASWDVTRGRIVCAVDAPPEGSPGIRFGFGDQP